MNNIIDRVWKQSSMTYIEDLQGSAFSAESGGHTFRISGVDSDENPLALSGSVAASFLRPDLATVAISGSVSGGVVSVTLPANCYDVPGRFGLVIFLTSDGQKTAIYSCVGNVARSSTSAVAPQTTADVVDLINQINAAVATIPASYTNLMAAVAPTYSSSALYPVGAYAWNDGKLYRAISPITTAESWTAAHWIIANLGDDVRDLKSALDRLFDLNLLQSKAVETGTDYNDLLTPGTYYCISGIISSVTNCPTLFAHKMVVLYTANAFGRYQIIFDQNAKIYYRNFSGGQWQSWFLVGDATAESVQNLSDELNNQVYYLKNIKADRRIKVVSSIGTQETGAAGLDGNVMSADSHIEISVSQGEIYYVTGWAYNSNFPLYTVKDADGNVIANGTIANGYHTNILALMPENSATLYVRGRRIGSGLEPYIYSTYSPYIIESSGNTTDRTTEIQTALNNYGYVTLGTGVFIVKNLNMPQNSMLEGSGDSTILKYNDNETNAGVILLNTDMTEQSPSVLTVKNLKLEGGLSSRPGTYPGRNGRVGIHHLARNTLLRLENVTITGFLSDGLHVEYVGLEEGYSVQMTNCLVKYCGCGINMDAKAEYANFTNVLVHFCYTGINNYGGNNKYANCGIENNVKGFQLDRSTDYADSAVSYLNNGHSSATGCSFNHNTYPVVGGIYYNGFAFVGCMFYAGTILIANQVKGLLFAACMIGANTGITISRNYLVRFSNCTFSEVPENVSLPSDHTLIKFIECYELENGTEITY